MYSLALDESGTHLGAPVVVVAGIAVHEDDLKSLEALVDMVLTRHLKPLGLNAFEYEAHAYELKTPTGRPGTPWGNVDADVRLAIYDDLYVEIANYETPRPSHPVRVIAAVIDQRNKTPKKAEKAAYDFVFKRFTEILNLVETATGTTERGLIIHDRRDGYDLPLQQRVATSQRLTGAYGNLLHVPVFTDSRTSRLVQIADLVAYSMWRCYSAADDAKASSIMHLAGTGSAGEIQDVLHQCPEFRHQKCACLPCTSRYLQS